MPTKLKRTAVWGGVSEEARALRLNATLESIVDRLDHLSPDQIEDFSLGQGASGIALFYAYLASFTMAPSHSRRAEQFLMRAHDLASQRAARLGLFDGLAGVAWATMHLAGEPLPSVCTVLQQATAEATSRSDYDLLFGTAGFAVCALALPSSPQTDALLVACCEQLCRRATAFHPLPLWWTEAPNGGEGGFVDLGVAHGISGALPVLARALRSGRLPTSLAARVQVLTEASVAFLLGCEIAPSERGMFPDRFVPGHDGRGSRLSWCYGDVGIAMALLVTSAAIDSDALRLKATSIALHGVTRTWTGAETTSICHGSAGLAHVYARLWQFTGDCRFRDAAASWYDTLTTDTVVGGGFAALRPQFLTGDSGIGLVLISSLSDIDPDWDQVLLCSPID